MTPREAQRLWKALNRPYLNGEDPLYRGGDSGVEVLIAEGINKPNLYRESQRRLLTKMLRSSPACPNFDPSRSEPDTVARPIGTRK
jgi:hypothetical protein